MVKCEYCQWDAELDALENRSSLMTSNGCSICKRCGTCLTHGTACKEVSRGMFKMTAEQIDKFIKENMDGLPEGDKEIMRELVEKK